MQYLLDTCVVSDFIKNIGNTIEHVKKHNPLHLSISTITLMEIEYGLEKLPSRAEKIRNIIYAFTSTINIIPFDNEAVLNAAKIRAELSNKGTPIGAYDVLIAGVALANDLVLVTANTKEFERIKDLKIENWRL
ncbi:type II toxin-antitoxin system VapC family toxin [Candidatus Jidaibacter acanthamoebae]|nr:type II toxin-antitoxin system VapC family toxin [Candidatus Jidaibacter acanthamoeba]MBA8667951.1 type II toxin-antitoxin system VapC family toxin [Holosporaceae bacterium 'Namur']